MPLNVITKSVYATDTHKNKTMKKLTREEMKNVIGGKLLPDDGACSSNACTYYGDPAHPNSGTSGTCGSMPAPYTSCGCNGYTDSACNLK